MLLSEPPAPLPRVGVAALALALAAVSPLAAQAPGEVVINEFVTRNDSIGGYREPSGGFGDWIELFNTTDREIDLSGANLSDTTAGEELAKWAFPDGVAIAAGGYLIVWADDDDEPEKMQEGIHASWRLGSSEAITLSRDGQILDQVVYEDGEANVAFARVPNGTGDFVKQVPTPLANNETLGLFDAAPAVRLRAFPSPARGGVVTVELGGEAYARYEVLDASGARVRGGAVPRGAEALRLGAAGLAPGLHVVSLDGGAAAATFAIAD